MFDKKYLGDGNSKEIESEAEAIAILMKDRYCSHIGNCKDCPLSMYEPKEVATCSVVWTKALQFLGIDEHLRGTEIFDLLEKKASGRKELCEGTCEGCLHSKEHTSGLLFCESFHNFTHKEGFCYRFEDGKME